MGTTLLGAFLGRKVISAGSLGRASTAARAGSRTWKEMQDVARAGETVEALKQQLADMEAEFTAEVQALESAESQATEVLDRVSVKLKKTNIADWPVLDALLARCAGQYPIRGVISVTSENSAYRSEKRKNYRSSRGSG